MQGFKELTSLMTSCFGFSGERLVPASFLPAICQVNKTGDPAKAYELLCQFPEVNRYTLLYVCHVWSELSHYSSVNKMTVDNICICVSPSMMHTKEWGSSEGVRHSTLQFVEWASTSRSTSAVVVFVTNSATVGI